MARLTFCLLALFFGTRTLEAHRLPLTVYTTAQGLPRNSAYCLVPDPSGLLWICTSEGLVRFDGSEFRTFNKDQGLPSSWVLGFIVSPKGGYWVMTEAGVCRLPQGSKAGDACQPLPVDQRLGNKQGDKQEDNWGSNVMIESSDERVWAASVGTIYRSSLDGKRLEHLPPLPDAARVEALALAPDNQILITTTRGAFLWNGRSYYHLPAPLRPGCGIGAIVTSALRDVWVEGNCSIYHVEGWDSPNVRLESVSFGSAVSSGHIALLRDHTVWLTTSAGLIHFERLADRSWKEKERLTTTQGLPSLWIPRFAEDSQGSLWGSTEGLGIFRISATGFRVYDSEDGLGTARIGSIFEDQQGDLCVTTTVLPGTKPPSPLRVKNGDRFDLVDLHPGPAFHDWGWGWNQVALQAHNGEWWLQSDKGLYRYPIAAHPQRLNGVAPSQIYDRSTGLATNDIFRIFEDSIGDIWLTTISPKNELIRWERATGAFHHWTVAEGWPVDGIATVMREAKNSVLWFGTFADVVRFRDGRLEKLATPPLSVVRDLLIDRAGSVWIATARNGVFRCDDPEAPAPSFRHYGAHEGLSADSTRSVTEDNSGFIYIGTARGVDRIDPRAPIGGGNITHFTEADGLPEGEQVVSYKDHTDHLWFGTLRGLAEYDPSQPAVRPIPEVYIRRIRVRGEEVPLPWDGTHNFDVRLQSHENQVEIEYAGIDLRSLASLRYQYRLSGVDSDWSPASPRSSVNYANLPPGNRTFEVRAVAADGTVGPKTAVLTMALEAPLWRRAWFVATEAFFLTAFIYWLYNYRVRSLLAMERLRTRIATDLHDDIGASLTQISLLSEVGSRDSSRNVLGDVAGIARDMVQEMSDIVWAVSPRAGKLEGFDSIVHRMRAFAEDATADRELMFDTSELPADLPLPLEYRRPLYLVFKEAVNNVVRHANATRLVIRVAAKDGDFILTIQDNGSGFDPTLPADGQGLASIRRRIKELHGEVGWDSGPGKGTTLTATVPLRLSKLGGMAKAFQRLR